MGPKPIQDVAPPRPAKGTTEPPAGPEIVHDIPVRQPTQNANYGEGPLPGGGDQSPSFIESIHVPEVNKPGLQVPHLDRSPKDKAGSKPKTKKSRPVLATMVFLAALVCLAAGTYLKLNS